MYKTVIAFRPSGFTRHKSLAQLPTYRTLLAQVPFVVSNLLSILALAWMKLGFPEVFPDSYWRLATWHTTSLKTSLLLRVKPHSLSLETKLISVTLMASYHKEVLITCQHILPEGRISFTEESTVLPAWLAACPSWTYWYSNTFLNIPSQIGCM